MKAANLLCRRLMHRGFVPVWQVAASLAMTEMFTTGDEESHELLAFAMSHCPDDQVLYLMPYSSNFSKAALPRGLAVLQTYHL